MVPAAPPMPPVIIIPPAPPVVPPAPPVVPPAPPVAPPAPPAPPLAGAGVSGSLAHASASAISKHVAVLAARVELRNANIGEPPRPDAQHAARTSNSPGSVCSRV
jgi:hypothetical protein